MPKVVTHMHDLLSFEWPRTYCRQHDKDLRRTASKIEETAEHMQVYNNLDYTSYIMRCSMRIEELCQTKSKISYPQM